MKARNVFLLLIASAVMPFSLSGQEPGIKIQLDTASFLFGQPVYARYSVSNPSESPLYISVYSGSYGGSQLLRWNAEACRQNGQLVPYHKDYTRYVGEEERLPKRALKKGEPLEVYQPVPITDVTLPELMPGPYMLKFTLNYSLNAAEGQWEKEKKEEIPFRITEAIGEDARYLADLWQSIQLADRDCLMRPDKSTPLRWNEVLHPPVKGLLSSLLVKHPTSTYAGYALASKVPDYSDPLMHPTPPQEQIRQCRDEGKTFITFPDKAFEEYFLQLDRFIKGGRVPEPLRASLWCFYGDQLVRRGKFHEALEAFSEAAKAKEPFDPKEKAYWQRAQESIKAFGGDDTTAGGALTDKPPTPPAPAEPAKPVQAPAAKPSDGGS